MISKRPAFSAARNGLSLSLLLALGACASVPLTSVGEDEEAKRFDRPDQDRGALYIYRQGWMAVGKNVDVSIAGGARAELMPNTFMRLDGPPGPVEIACTADNTDTRQIEIAAGQTRFVEVALRPGWWGPQCEVAEVPPDRGKAAVRGGKRVVAQ
ncbi:MAG: hypothetical protein ACHQK9_05785 [Reyranellales bacterium]